MTRVWADVRDIFWITVDVIRNGIRDINDIRRKKT